MKNESSNSIEISKVNKKILKGLTLTELKEFFSSVGQPKFRGEQLFNWMYNHLALDFSEMSDFPKDLRKWLNDNCESKTLEVVDSIVSNETGTQKFIFETKEKNRIESVIIPEEKRTTLCVSTQVGCPLDCKFCATGMMGYKKNLSSGEIFDQYLLASNHYGKDKITNIVYMGMGEPLLNYESTLRSLKIFADNSNIGISIRRITISTAGIAPKIFELAESGLKVKLAFSLHSCFEEIRTKIMPINIKYSLKENIAALKHYIKKTGTKITFEYVMLNGINDTDRDLKALIKLCRGFSSKVNVIPFNSLSHMDPTGYSASLEPTPADRIKEFVNKLRESGIIVIVRYTQGEDIAAACGQLAANYN